MGKSIPSFFYLRKINTFFQILKKHKWAIILAILVGIIMALPHIYFIFDNKDTYQGVFMGGLDEEFYLTRMQEIRDGYFSLANPVWLEGKNLPYLRPPLSEIIASIPGQIFNISLINTVLFENFLFPLILFLIIYSLVYQLIKKKSVALISSVAVLLTSNLTNPQAIWNLLINQKVNDMFLAYTRLISPQVHSLFLFSFFLFFWIFLKKEKWIYGGISSIILGFSFYVYPYTWTFIYAFLSLLIFLFLFRKNWRGIKNIILIMGIGFFIAIPYFLNLWHAMHHSFYSELALRTGIINNHAFQIGATVLILIAIFLLFPPKDFKKRYDFCLALILTPFIVLNQQIITGHLLTSAHYHYYYHKPIAIIFLIMIIFSQLEQRVKKINIRKVFWSSFVVIVLFICFYNAFLVQTHSYRMHESNGIAKQQYGVIFQWLNKYGQLDEVVMSNFIISDLIPIYTSLNAVSNMDGHYYLASNEDQLLERMFLQYRLNGLNSEEIIKMFFQNKEEISKKIYGQRYRKTLGSYENIPDEKLYSFAEKYMDFLNIPLEDILKKYHVKYLVWDIIKQPNWQIDQYSFFDQVYEQNNLKIYVFNE